MDNHHHHQNMFSVSLSLLTLEINGQSYYHSDVLAPKGNNVFASVNVIPSSDYDLS